MDLDSGIALISLDEAKEYLDIPNGEEPDTSADEIIQSLINEVSSVVTGYLGRSLLKKTKTEYYCGDNSDLLILNHKPIVSITSIHVDNNRQFGSMYLIDPSNYYIQKQNGMVKAFQLYGIWPYGDANIKVVYQAGYDLAAANEAAGGLPNAIKLAVKRLLDRHYRAGFTNRKLDISSETVSERTTTFRDTELPKDVQGMLAPFRRFIPSPQFSHADADA